jgi:hypothetical protein
MATQRYLWDTQLISERRRIWMECATLKLQPRVAIYGLSQM